MGRSASAITDDSHASTVDDVLRGARVLTGKDGQPLTQKMVQNLVNRAARRAKVPAGIHILRHTYCSHLAMRRGSAREIQELAGHQNLATTQRHMQLTPATLRTTVQLLDQPGNVPAVGDGASADD